MTADTSAGDQPSVTRTSTGGSAATAWTKRPLRTGKLVRNASCRRITAVSARPNAAGSKEPSTANAMGT
jgi:hypothetical protein